MWPKKNIYQTDHTVKPLIFELIKDHKNPEARDYFAKNPKDIHLKGWMDDTPLHIACLNGNMEMVRFLVEHGANVNAQRDGIFASPLSWAYNEEMAEYLLKNGAKVDKEALLTATRANKIGIMDLLLKNGAAINPEELQYLHCRSKESICVYLKYKMEINGCDRFGSNLLHQLAWLDLPEVFDFAFENGVPWKKDSSKRTPYFLAKQGRRTLFANHIATHYPELVLNKIRPLDLNMEYENILFLAKSPVKKSSYIALTENGKLIDYEVQEDNSLEITAAVEIDLPNIRNFTADQAGHLLIPTAENRLLKINASDFKLIETIVFDEEIVFDQLTWLPGKNIYIGSGNWKIIVLDKDLKVICLTSAESGTLYPLINDREDLLAFWSYGQDETFFDLYRITNENEVEFLHMFYDDRDDLLDGFAFMGSEILVAYPRTIKLYALQENTPVKMLERYIEASGDNICHLVVISNNLFLYAKGRKLTVYEKTHMIKVVEEIHLDLKDVIRRVCLDAETMNVLITTSSEMKVLDLKDRFFITD